MNQNTDHLVTHVVTGNPRLRSHVLLSMAQTVSQISLNLTEMLDNGFIISL